MIYRKKFLEVKLKDFCMVELSVNLGNLQIWNRTTVTTTTVEYHIQKILRRLSIWRGSQILIYSLNLVKRNLRKYQSYLEVAKPKILKYKLLKLFALKWASIIGNIRRILIILLKEWMICKIIGLYLIIWLFL